MYLYTYLICVYIYIYIIMRRHLSLSLYIYIYVYMCVCVCVCAYVCLRRLAPGGLQSSAAEGLHGPHHILQLGDTARLRAQAGLSTFHFMCCSFDVG